tara:strand:+ start:83 stop:268 length:186 start_codon:yes stop_codon:yes gene_type:complete
MENKIQANLEYSKRVHAAISEIRGDVCHSFIINTNQEKVLEAAIKYNVCVDKIKRISKSIV